MGARVLVVEDDRAMAHLVTRALEREGHTVTTVYCAADAGDALAAGDFDLLVLDLFLPDGDGLAVCSQLREVHDVPVLMISSLDAELGESVVGTPFGPNAFLAKPFRFDELVAHARQLLAGQEG
ncbi:MAG: response regulator [Armatimonadetes bacterium]|nr:response regulator [Armatimonadota bacterium]